MLALNIQLFFRLPFGLSTSLVMTSRHFRIQCTLLNKCHASARIPNHRSLQCCFLYSCNLKSCLSLQIFQPRSFPENLMDILRSHQEEILAYLEEHATWFGSYMTQTPSSRLSHCILVFLLSWQIILRLFQDSAPGYRAAYANFFRKQDMIGPLLTVLFSILPHDKGHLLSTEPVAVDGKRQALIVLPDNFFFLVGYVEERPCWPIQSPNKERKKKAISKRITVVVTNRKWGFVRS